MKLSKIFSSRRINEPAKEVQYLIPKGISWRIEDINVLEAEGNYQEALKRWNILLTPFQDHKFKEDPRLIQLKSHRVIWLHIGLCYRHLDIYEKAIEAYNKAIVLADEVGDSGILIEILNGLGVVYRHMGNIMAALSHYKKALREAEFMLDKMMIVVIRDNIAHCYLEQGLLDKALNEEMKAYSMLSFSPSKISLQTHARVLGNLGFMYWNFGKHQKGIRFMEKGLVKAREAGDYEQESLILEYLKKAK